MQQNYKCKQINIEDPTTQRTWRNSTPKKIKITYTHVHVHVYNICESKYYVEQKRLWEYLKDIFLVNRKAHCENFKVIVWWT